MEWFCENEHENKWEDFVCVLFVVIDLGGISVSTSMQRYIYCNLRLLMRSAMRSGADELIYR